MNTQDIVKKAYFENNVLKIDVQLEREDYVSYNNVLERFGGKWNKKAGGHIFDGNPKPYIDLYLETGELPDKNPLAFFFTPDHVIETIFSELGSHIGYKSLSYLEPSAGTGSIVSKLIEEGSEDITAVELDPYRFKILQNKHGNLNLINDDFLTARIEKKFDVVIMNPPFSVDGNSTCYIDHIYKAYSVLNDGGVLASVVPVGWLTSNIKKQKAFREWVYENGYYFRLDEKSFKESGTLVGCAIVIVEKLHQKEYERLCREEVYGYLNHFVYQISLNADCSSSFYNKKLELHKKLEAGLDVSPEVKNIYLQVVDEMRKNGEFVLIKEEWLDWLVDEFGREYESEYK